MGLDILIIFLFDIYVLTPLNARETLPYFANGLIVLSVAPIFYPLFFLFAEFYFSIIFRIFRLSWFQERKLVNKQIVWAKKKHTDENEANIAGE